MSPDGRGIIRWRNPPYESMKGSPKNDHACPFHLYSEPEPLPHAATMSPLGRTTCPVTPAPTVFPNPDHVWPFHRAMYGYGWPPASEKLPETITSPLAAKPMFSTGALELVRGIPLPSECQECPSHRAMLCAAMPPMVTNPPATMTSPLGATAIRKTRSFVPLPMPDQVAPSH